MRDLGQIDASVVRHTHFGGFEDEAQDDPDQVRRYVLRLQTCSADIRLARTKEIESRSYVGSNG